MTPQAGCATVPCGELANALSITPDVGPLKTIYYAFGATHIKFQLAVEDFAAGFVAVGLNSEGQMEGTYAFGFEPQATAIKEQILGNQVAGTHVTTLVASSYKVDDTCLSFTVPRTSHSFETCDGTWNIMYSVAGGVNAKFPSFHDVGQGYEAATISIPCPTRRGLQEDTQEFDVEVIELTKVLSAAMTTKVQQDSFMEDVNEKIDDSDEVLLSGVALESVGDPEIDSDDQPVTDDGGGDDDDDSSTIIIIVVVFAVMCCGVCTAVYFMHCRGDGDGEKEFEHKSSNPVVLGEGGGVQEEGEGGKRAPRSSEGDLQTWGQTNGSTDKPRPPPRPPTTLKQAKLSTEGEGH
eukprot:UN33376